MSTEGVRHDTTRNAIVFGSSTRDRRLGTLVVIAIRVVLVLVTAVLAIGSIALGDGFDWRTLLPVALGWPVTLRLHGASRAMDERAEVRIDPAGVHWSGVDINWGEIAALRRTRRYVRVGGTGPSAAGGSAITHGLVVVRHDGQVLCAPETSDRLHYPRGIVMAHQHGLVPHGVRVVSLDPATVPADHQPPSADELPPVAPPAPPPPPPAAQG